ncbi:MAG: ABC transporter permease, partial [Tepidisphaeraceae bacterium]
FYTTFMFALSVLLVMPSIVLLRRMAQSSVSLRTWLMEKLRLSSADRTRKPRNVWHNPIAWREAKTKASAARASILRYGFIAAGIIGALVLVIFFATPATVPNKSISPGSYDPLNKTLFINGETTYGVGQRTAVFLRVRGNNEPVPQSILEGRFAVDSVTTALTRQKTKVITSIVLLEIPRMLDGDLARKFLLGAVILEFAVILLIVTNAAASTVTREKEDGSLDLLLTTPITSRYYVWGKLRGLVSFVFPLVAVPVLSAGMFIVYDVIRMARGGDPRFKWIVFPEAVLVMPMTLVIVSAFAAILGMQMSLRCRTTVRAVMVSVGIVLGACLGLGWCGAAFLGLGRGPDSTFSLMFASFSPFTLITLLIDPWTMAGRSYADASAQDVIAGRIVVFVASFVAAAAYAFVVWSMYKSMVKNFDMTIRKQSR